MYGNQVTFYTEFNYTGTPAPTRWEPTWSYNDAFTSMRAGCTAMARAEEQPAQQSSGALFAVATESVKRTATDQSSAASGALQ